MGAPVVADAAAATGSGQRSSEGVADGDRREISVSFFVYVGGIYACFISCSLLHESIYRARSPSGDAVSPWVVGALEALANTLVAAAGMCLWEGMQPLVPQRGLATTGGLQLLSKYCASASRVQGLPGPVLTLVKSARPLPVMLGQRLIAGTHYTPREYVQYALIVSASVMVGTAKSSAPSDGVSTAAMLLLLLSTACDGYIGGRQKEMKNSVRAHRRSHGLAVEDLQPFEMQFYTNVYMLLTASACSLWLGDWRTGLRFLREDPDVALMVLQYAVCSAVGQVFIFACVSRFDPLTLSVVTSSRKLASVMVMLVLFGYEVNTTCLVGLAFAVGGFALVLSDEVSRRRAPSVNPKELPKGNMLEVSASGEPSPGGDRRRK